MVRLFVGLEIPEPLVYGLAAARGGVEGAHWQRDNQLHLTLAFIGDVSRQTFLEIEDALSGVWFDPFEMGLMGVGFFGKPKQPKALWAGLEDRGPVIHLHEKVMAALDRVGVETERRKFKPHVTLARFSRGNQSRIGDWLTNNELLHTPRATIDSFTLFSSERTSEGSFYRQEALFGASGRALSCDDQADEFYRGNVWPAFSAG